TDDGLGVSETLNELGNDSQGVAVRGKSNERKIIP
ncbi:unnamed protein product, partial [Rotaria magnacalcarata]